MKKKYVKIIMKYAIKRKIHKAPSGVLFLYENLKRQEGEVSGQ